MTTLPVKIELPDSCKPHIAYAWQLFASHFQFETLETPEATLTIGLESGDIQISYAFKDLLENRRFNQQEVFDNEPVLKTTEGIPDYLGTAFYMVNSLQEYDENEKDEFGRFPFDKSYQVRFSCEQDDLVTNLFEKLSEELNATGKLNIEKRTVPSRIFITHDIDRINEAFKREGKWAIKKGRPDLLLRQAVKYPAGKSDWLNIAEIMDLHKDRNLCSTFFWLVKQGTDEHGIRNADYSVNDPKIQEVVNHVDQSSFVNGLHKSTMGSSYNEELETLPQLKPYNRNHYLKFTLPHLYNEVQESEIQLDSSMGLSEAIGFRNSNGLPFQPFNLEQQIPYDFLEVPLNVMDTALFKSVDNVADSAIEFLEANKAGKVITLLWHNNYLTNHKFKKERADYVRILDYLRDSSYEPVTPSDLLSEFGRNIKSATIANRGR